jgi:hypothetical protein
MWTGEGKAEVSIYNIGSFDGMGNFVVDFWIITGFRMSCMCTATLVMLMAKSIMCQLQ